MRQTEDAGIAVPGEAIAVLDLSADEVESLRRQGFVAHEPRKGGTVIFKLRFRHGGRQRVRCLGSDPGRAAAIVAELAILQAAWQRQQRRRRLIRQSQQLLRSIKPRLVAAVAAAGLKFHGRTIRRPRTS